MNALGPRGWLIWVTYLSIAVLGDAGHVSADTARLIAGRGLAAPALRFADQQVITHGLHVAGLTLSPDLQPGPPSSIAAVLRALDCARVSARFDPQKQVVTLSGHVASHSQRTQLRQRLTALPNVTSVQDQALIIIGSPYCRVLAFLDRPGLTRSEDQKQDLETIMGSAGEAGVVSFAGGSLLELNLQAPSFPAYIYVDYYSSEGNVYHLLDSSDARGNRFTPDERFVVGGPRGRGIRDATIAPPYGLDLAVAIASSEPLLLQPRTTAEGTVSYLEALDAAIEERNRREPPLQLEYAYFIIKTTPPRKRNQSR